MGSMDEILRRSLLFDFYGELLTDHQKEIYEAFDSEDMSLGEIAAQEGISRQGVHDLIRRVNKILENYESKLHLVERFMNIRNQAQEIREHAESLLSEDDPGEDTQHGSDAHSGRAFTLQRIIALTDELMEEL